MATTRVYPDIFDHIDNFKPQDIPPEPYSPANIERARLYYAVRSVFRRLFGYGLALEDKPSSFASTVTEDEEIRFAGVFGQLLLSGYSDPSFGHLNRGVPSHRDEMLPKADAPNVEPDPNDASKTIDLRVLIAPEFRGVVSDAVKKFNENLDLFKQVWLQLRDKGVGKLNGVPTATLISTKRLYEVTQRLINRGVSPTDPNIQMLVLNAIAVSLDGDVGGVPSAIDISLPDLDAGTAVDIVPDNVRAVQVIYFSAQLEEMRLHAVIDKLVEHFQTGMLPITRGRAADKIYAWIKESPQRLAEPERRGIYGRVLGLAQGATNEGVPNREFSDLWTRFLSTVSVKYREVFSFQRDEVSVEQIHKAARDLAVNVSLHGYGIAHPAAVEMQRIIAEMLGMLDESDVLSAYGVRDRWQLVERVGALYLGGATNGVRYRTIAQSGEKVLAWLADHSSVLASSSASGLKLIDYSSGAPRPTDDFRIIAELAERWLAVTGTQDDATRKSSEPVDLQNQYTVPLLGQSAGIPASVQDTFRQIGIGPNLPAIPQA